MKRVESDHIEAVLRARVENSAIMEPGCANQPDAADAAYEALFGNIPRQNERKVTRAIPLDKLHTFHTANIGFKPYSAEHLQALADDIDEHGLLENIKVLPDADGYEILSGHNRVNACRLLGWSIITADIENADDSRAIIIATVPNLQHRQRLSPCERAWAFRSLLEANKHQGQRTDLEQTTSVGKQQKLDARDRVAHFFSVKRNEVCNTVRLTCPPPSASASEISSAWSTIFQAGPSTRRIKKNSVSGEEVRALSEPGRQRAGTGRFIP